MRNTLVSLEQAILFHASVPCIRFFVLSPPNKLLLCFQGPASCWLLQVFSSAPKVTDIPCFSKVCFPPLCVYRRPTLVPVFANQEESKGGFHFYKTSKQQKQHSAIVLQPAVEASGHPEQSSQSGLVKLLPRELLSASQHQAAIAFNRVCEHLCSILCVLLS